jgi:uncharacterized protein (TIGR03437 family)
MEPTRNPHLHPFLALFLAICPAIFAQPEDRLHAPIDSRNQIPLHGTRNPRIANLPDDGPVASEERIQGLGFRFKPTQKQTAALEALLEEQQDPWSPNYHAWLTPEEYGDRFGLSPNDYARVSAWLQSEGFQIDSNSRSRTWITFSGTARHLRRTFGVDLHRFQVKGRAHYASVGEAQIPAALESLVYTLRGLDNLPAEPRARIQPRMNLQSGDHALGPGDLATIYNINPLLQRGFDGSGQKIVVAGKSTLKLSDLRAFRDLYGLPQNDPKIILVPGFPDPGTNDEFEEVTADVELVGAIARKATIFYVNAPAAWAAVEYAIDQNLAPVISYSFGGCEKDAVSQPELVQASHGMAQQANAQGITWVASTGDTGVAGCESQREDAMGVSGMSISLPAGFPEVTAVGGTMFVEGSGNYWASGYTKAVPTALSYIPEAGWNDLEGPFLAASSGGASMFYTRPSWQAGPGVPNGNWRMVPDLSFAADWTHDPYIIVFQGDTWSWGGTSAATPVFAGVLTILNQYLVSTGVQSKPGLGNVNPRLYQMARSTSGVFHDVTAGNNIVPCKIGTPDCTTGKYGSTATSGWDAVTGLGSLDVNNFVLNWQDKPNMTVPSTTVSATANPATIATGGSALMTAVVKPASGAALPTGPVYFSLGQTSLGYANLATTAGTASASLTVKSGQLATGTNTIAVFYGGSSDFLSSTTTVVVTVSAPAATASAVTVTAQPSPVYKQAPDPDGYAWYYTLTLTETAGLATKVTSFTIDGADYSPQIPAIFGDTTLPAHGTLTAAMRSRIASVPADRTFAFAGIDPGGRKWTQQVMLSFLGEPSSSQVSGAISLTSVPATVRQMTKPDPHCPADRPLYQQIYLNETNGAAVRLTKLMADGADLSDQIQSWFGSLRLAPFGTLHAEICWESGAPPITRSFQVEGIDGAGNTVKSNIQVAFRTGAALPGTLAVSKNQVQLLSDSGLAGASINVTLPAGESWNVTAIAMNRKTSWLTASPASGKGPAQVNLSASAAGLANGVYVATLIFQAEFMTPQIIEVPVVFAVGISGDTQITGAQNAASFQPAFAPGMLMSLYGTNLANSTQAAKSIPLPLNLGSVMATVNGVPAPLWFVSPGQINVQIPYETALGSALVVVNNNGQAGYYVIHVTAAAPGIFNNSGALTPAATASRGSSVSIYVTGEGELVPMLETGVPPSANISPGQLPHPRGAVKVTVGGVPADVTFVGNPWLVGITQWNFTVPANAPTGAQPVVVLVGGVPSVPQTLTVK